MLADIGRSWPLISLVQTEEGKRMVILEEEEREAEGVRANTIAAAGLLTVVGLKLTPQLIKLPESRIKYPSK